MTVDADVITGVIPEVRVMLGLLLALVVVSLQLVTLVVVLVVVAAVVTVSCSESTENCLQIPTLKDSGRNNNDDDSFPSSLWSSPLFIGDRSSLSYAPRVLFFSSSDPNTLATISRTKDELTVVSFP